MGDAHVGEVAAIQAFERIRSLKHRYLRAVDTKDWMLLESTLAADCRFDFGDGERKFSSRDEFLRFQRDTLSSTEIVSMHVAFQPEIELEGTESASGRWALFSEVRLSEGAIVNRQFAFYDDRYRLEQGDWVIASTRYRRVFGELESNRSIESFAVGSLLAPPAPSNRE